MTDYLKVLSDIIKKEYAPAIREQLNQSIKLIPPPTPKRLAEMRAEREEEERLYGAQMAAIRSALAALPDCLKYRLLDEYREWDD